MSNVYNFPPKLPNSPPGGGLKGGNGGGTYDDMETRVANLEKRFDRFEAKLDGLITSTAEVKGLLNAMPTGIAFGELKGRVDSLPTTAKVATLFGIAVAVITIATKWSDLKTLLGF